jgi:hypothetical protein
MLLIYPATPVNLGWITLIFSMTKWVFVGISIILVATGIVAAIVNQIPKKELETPAANKPKESLSLKSVANISFATEITQKRKG